MVHDIWYICMLSWLDVLCAGNFHLVLAATTPMRHFMWYLPCSCSCGQAEAQSG